MTCKTENKRCTAWEAQHYCDGGCDMIAEIAVAIPLTTKTTASKVVVDQNYFWNYDMTTCPQGKVQLLSIDNLPLYGHYKGNTFYKAWAPIPSNPPGH